MVSKANLLALLAVLVLAACSKPDSGNGYKVVTVGWTNGPISQPTLYRKDGDPDHLYMQDLSGTSWIRLQK